MNAYTEALERFICSDYHHSESDEYRSYGNVQFKVNREFEPLVCEQKVGKITYAFHQMFSVFNPEMVSKISKNFPMSGTFLQDVQNMEMWTYMADVINTVWLKDMYQQVVWAKNRDIHPISDEDLKDPHFMYEFYGYSQQELDWMDMIDNEYVDLKEQSDEDHSFERAKCEFDKYVQDSLKDIELGCGTFIDGFVEASDVLSFKEDFKRRYPLHHCIYLGRVTKHHFKLGAPVVPHHVYEAKNSNYFKYTIGGIEQQPILLSNSFGELYVMIPMSDRIQRFVHNDEEYFEIDIHFTQYGLFAYKLEWSHKDGTIWSNDIESQLIMI